MDFKLVQYACDLRVWVQWLPPFDPQGREKIFGSPLRGGTCHVPRAAGRLATGIVVSAFRCDCHPGPDRTSRSSSRTPQERHPQWILSWYSTRVTCEFGFSGCPRLILRGARKFLVVLYGAARATCHVPPADSRPAPLSFRRFGASIGATPVPIGPAVRAPCPEMLGHTDTLTNTIRPTFFQRPTGGNLRS